MSLHAAARGYQSGASAYERARPGYAPEAITSLVASLGIEPGTCVLDVGAGTGKLTRQLVDTGARLIAVEPVAEMREQFRRAIPGVEVLEGTAEALPLPAASMDAAVVGQAWHWFDAPAALAELTRVVALGGGLALLFNDFDGSTPFAAQLARIRDRRAPADVPDPRSGVWRLPFQDHPAWTPLTEQHFHHEHRLTRAGVIDRLLSSSCIAALPADEQDGVRREVLAILDRHTKTRGQDEVLLPYRTELYCSRRR